MNCLSWNGELGTNQQFEIWWLWVELLNQRLCSFVRLGEVQKKCVVFEEDWVLEVSLVLIVLVLVVVLPYFGVIICMWTSRIQMKDALMCMCVWLLVL